MIVWRLDWSIAIRRNLNEKSLKAVALISRRDLDHALPIEPVCLIVCAHTVAPCCPGRRGKRVPCMAGLRDRALLGTMVYSFARVSAVVGMNVEDYYQQGKRWWLRLHEKGGKHHEVPAHHKAEEYLDVFIAAAGTGKEKGTPLWRNITKERGIGKGRMHRVNVYRMIQPRIRQAKLKARVNCHTFPATGTTAYLLNGGAIENTQAIAAHEIPRTTKLYDRTTDEIERIGI
jgi:integrase/recombinase XerD